MEFIQNCIREAEWELGLEAHTEINKIGSGKNDRMECHIKEIMFHLEKKKNLECMWGSHMKRIVYLGQVTKGLDALLKRA